MNRNIRSWSRPPWSGQIVRPWVKYLAWAMVSLLILAASLWIGQIARGDETIPLSNSVLALWLCGEFYFFILLVHIAMKGSAPTTWWPWK